MAEDPSPEAVLEALADADDSMHSTDELDVSGGAGGAVGPSSSLTEEEVEEVMAAAAAARAGPRSPSPSPTPPPLRFSKSQGGQRLGKSSKSAFSEPKPKPKPKLDLTVTGGAAGSDHAEPSDTDSPYNPHHQPPLPQVLLSPIRGFEPLDGNSIATASVHDATSRVQPIHARGGERFWRSPLPVTHMPAPATPARDTLPHVAKTHSVTLNSVAFSPVKLHQTHTKQMTYSLLTGLINRRRPPRRRKDAAAAAGAPGATGGTIGGIAGTGAVGPTSPLRTALSEPALIAAPSGTALPTDHATPRYHDHTFYPFESRARRVEGPFPDYLPRLSPLNKQPVITKRAYGDVHYSSDQDREYALLTVPLKVQPRPAFPNIHQDSP